LAILSRTGSGTFGPVTVHITPNNLTGSCGFVFYLGLLSTLVSLISPLFSLVIFIPFLCSFQL
jgi:hypothetical protein